MFNLEPNVAELQERTRADAPLGLPGDVVCGRTAAIASTTRSVRTDNGEIGGGGGVLEQVESRGSPIQRGAARPEKSWQRSRLTSNMSAAQHGQRSTLVRLSGQVDAGKNTLATALEERPFEPGLFVCLGLSNAPAGLASGQYPIESYL